MTSPSRWCLLPFRRFAAASFVAVGLISATLLMTELALTRIFSVVMYYHFAFLAISIALFGLSASGVFAYVARRRLDATTDRRCWPSSRVVYARLHARRAVLRSCGCASG